MLRQKHVFQLYLVGHTVKCNLTLSSNSVASETPSLQLQPWPEGISPQHLVGELKHAHKYTLRR